MFRHLNAQLTQTTREGSACQAMQLGLLQCKPLRLSSHLLWALGSSYSLLESVAVRRNISRTARRLHSKFCYVASLMKNLCRWWCCLFGIASLGATAKAALAVEEMHNTQASPAALYLSPPLGLGTAWYPEQWPQSRWEADLSLMETAHINVVRVAEFAWSRLEPREGIFEFDWLDSAIAQAARHHIRVVVGTPSAAPPAWLTSKYRDVLRVNQDGRPDEHGERQQFSFTSRRYRVLARRIAEKLAIRYGHNPDVIGWQIDNEIGSLSFDQETRDQFHLWLQHRYGNIAALNEHWTTAYWSQTYDNFAEVPMHSKNENPGLLLDWKRFVTDTWASYIDNQVEAIRQHTERGQFITTNTMGWSSLFDHYVVHRSLDIAAWDEYAPISYEWLGYARQHDLVRGYKRQNFWVMETQPGFVDWAPINRPLDPGQVREIAWQAVGHGADAVLYWQWRSALNGQEQYHGTLVGADGTPVPVFEEVQKIGTEFARAADLLSGTTPHSRVAMLQSYESLWAIEFQRHHSNFDTIAEFDAFYRPLARSAQSIDVVSIDAPLQGYALVVAPALNVVSETAAELLADYVHNGGHLVLGPRSGMKDPYNALWPQRQPGPLAALLGARVEQFYALDQPIAVSGEVGIGRAQIWAETLEGLSPDVRVWMTYAEGRGWTGGKPAAITREVGKGSITYIGAWLEPSLMQKVTERLLKQAGVEPIIPGLPSDVEVCERSAKGKRVWIVINHGQKPQAVNLPGKVKTHIVGTGDGNTIQLAAHDVGVVDVSP
jgi:beta-galactosidase